MPEKVGTKEYGKMLKRIQAREDGGSPAKEARNRKIEGQKRNTTRKEYRRFWNEFEMRGFTAQQGLCNVARKKVLQDRSASPEEEGDIIREYKARHEENFLSS